MSYEKPNFTADQQAQRWLDRRNIENLMGRRFSYKLLKQEDRELKELWCKKAADPVLGFNDGCYKGYDAISGYFEALAKQADERVGYAKANYEALADKADSELHGVGSLSPYTLTTPVIEIAADGQTAKGLWYIVGAASDIGKNGSEAAWYRGKLAADFVLEDGAWKIWHLLEISDVFCRAGTNWVGNELAAEDFAAADTALPAKNAPAPAAKPGVPVPYGSFDSTFSYGV